MGPRRLTRRVFVAAGAAACARGAEHPQALAAEWRRYADPVTELEVQRLTDPSHPSGLPAWYNRAVSRRGNFLLFWSDRTGPRQAFRMDLRNGEFFQATHATDLDGSSLTLLPDERGFSYFDGRVLKLTSLPALRTREIYHLPEGWERTAGASVSDDGRHAFFGETSGKSSRLRLVDLRSGAARTVAESDTGIEHPIGHPRRDLLLYRSLGAAWLVNLDGRQNRRLKLAAGRTGPADWSPDGRSILYLNFPEERAQLNNIREYAPDQNSDQMVSKTSQFVHFGFNRNASVFVGASSNKASPTVLLLLRVTRREFTLCEHKASDPATVAPVFSPDSQRVFFNSDRDGKSAVYSMRVDKLVEKTDES